MIFDIFIPSLLQIQSLMKIVTYCNDRLKENGKAIAADRFLYIYLFINFGKHVFFYVSHIIE